MTYNSSLNKNLRHGLLAEGNKGNRIVEIDQLRGIAMTGMILIHSSYYFLFDKLALFLWNWSQFAVPVFVFCSAYLYFEKSQITSSYIKYVQKRFSRLLIPYYIFMFVFFIEVIIAKPAMFTSPFIIQSVFLIGGIDISWLVLLFLELTILLPIIHSSLEKNISFFYLLLVLSSISSVIFLFIHVGIPYKMDMWLPWTLLLFYAFFFKKYSSNKNFSISVIAISLILVMISRFILHLEGKSLSFFDNKYPPNIYFLSYGILSIEMLFFASKRNLFSFYPLKKLLHFLSKYSYSIFFIHYLFLSMYTGLLKKFHFTWFTFFLLVFVSAILFQYLFNRSRKTLAAVRRI